MIERKIWTAALVGVTALGGVLLSAPAASATGTLTVTVNECDTNGTRFICGGDSATGTRPFTYHWQVLGGGTLSGGPASDTATGTCHGNLVVQLTVTDATGATGSGQGGTYCDGLNHPWP